MSVEALVHACTLMSSFSAPEKSPSENSLPEGFGLKPESPELPPACVPQLIQLQANRTPDALAVRRGSAGLTYRNLDRRSNQLASLLRLEGTPPGSIVGVCLERSLDFVVAALAILKSGAAYLPLDPKLPQQRRTTILNDARPFAVVSHSKFIGPQMSPDWPFFALDARRAEFSSFSTDPVSVKLTPSALAYVIYTSGSTGTPKGVVVGHDNLLNLVRWHHRAFGVRPEDRASQLAAPGFDAAVWELWPYLAAGASVPKS